MKKIDLGLFKIKGANYPKSTVKKLEKSKKSIQTEEASHSCSTE